jgi:hypothetical protein
MKCFLVLSVVALAALGASGLQPAPSIGPGLNPVSSLLLTSYYVWLDSLYGPSDTIYGDTTIISTGADIYASRYAPNTEVRIDLWKDSVLRDTEIRTYNLIQGESVLVDYAFSVNGEPDYPGYYVVRDSIMDNQPTDSSVVTWRFWILPYGSVEEGRKQQALSRRLLPTVLRCPPAGAVVLDATGRRVLNPKPGIYFERTGAAARPQKITLVE